MKKQEKIASNARRPLDDLNSAKWQHDMLETKRRDPDYPG